MSTTPMRNWLDHTLKLLSPLAAARFMHDHPAWAWQIAHAITAQQNGLNQIVVSGGMGLPEDILLLPSAPEAVKSFVRRWKLACATRVSVWRGFDLRDIQGENEYMNQIDVMAALDTGTDYLSESGMDFLLARDQKRRIGCYLADFERSAEGIRSMFEYDEEDVRLAWDFRNQMIAEAEPQRYQVAAGAYILEHTPLAAVDKEFAWEAVRLIIHPRGIFAGFLFENVVMPMFWTPEGTNTSQVYVHPRAVFALDAMMACIWRDACVVREHWSERYASKQIAGRPTTERDQIKSRQNKALILPRTVYRVSWAAEPERVAIQRRAYTAHAVTACYPKLHDGFSAHDEAARAAEHGWPAPPAGRTFRKPHTRGTGAVQAEQPQRAVVCKGLLVANMILN